MAATNARTVLGTAALGDLADEDEAVATVVTAMRDGVCGLDTSPWYGRGAAELRVGRALQELPYDLSISTKVGYVVDPPGGRRQDFSADATLRSIEASMSRLGVTAIDTVLIHDPEDHMREALEGAYPVLQRLRSEGVVRAIGVGMNQVAGPVRFVRETDIDVVLIAGRYTLLDRSASHELLPLCRERAVEVWAGGVFNTGVLAAPEPGALYDYAPASPQILARAKALRYRCAEYGIPLAAAALQFPARHPAVAAVLLGPANRDQLADNLYHWRQPIPDELWAELNVSR